MKKLNFIQLLKDNEEHYHLLESLMIPYNIEIDCHHNRQTPREFIQRRGRILRKSEGKLFAHLYDAITVPIVECDETPKALSIIAGELSRSIQFGLDAENPACVTDLKNIALDFKIDFNSIQNTGIEEDSND